MAEQIGIVTQIDADGWARVLTDRKGGCGGCSSDHGGGCHTCLAGSKFECRVVNSAGAKPGDLVRISMRSRDLFKGAAVLYLLPVAALLIGAVAGGWMAGRIGWQITSGNVLGAVIGVAAAVLLLVAVDRSPRARSRLTPTMVEVLSAGKSSSPAPAVHHGCCG